VFVGRGEELAVLTDAVREVGEGQARAVLVGGEAGMGKSRLVAEAAAAAERTGFRVLRGQCVELGADGLALVPLVEALRTLARTTRPDELDALLGPAREELARLLPELAPASWPEPRTAPASTGQLLELVLGVLERVGARSPLLLVVEDVHWADRSTIELLAFLVRTLHAVPVCVLMTYRSDELHRRHPLRPFLRAWERHPAVRTVQLGAFTDLEVAAQMAGILGAEPDPQLLAVVSDRAEGNPFLVEEVVAAVRAGEPRLLHLAADGFGAGDRQAAGQALLEAATTAERIGAVPLVEEAAALARRARVSLSEPTGSEPEPADVDPLGGFGLTSREREILGLIAAGLSNGQIAAELFISPKTASVHVSRILAKLGVSGRIEAAAVVHRLGVLAPEAGAARP
jgi:DNA-binding CsgD family transcriptional regulator